MSLHLAPIASKGLKYRPYIDGLRGIAILSVVAFHAFPSWVTGGYAGVSTFFVISGYLISTIIFQNLGDKNFSFLAFYERRIRRIFPALTIVLITTYAVGWFFLLASEFKQLGLYIAGGSIFIDNFIAWSGAGYFDGSADLKPLLHLWSLGIEEQFYIVFPVLVWFAWNRNLYVIFGLIILCIFSFILNIESIKQDPVATFYAPWTRFWEIFSGCLLAYAHINYPQIRRVNLKLESLKKYILSFQSILGFSLTLYAIIFFTKETSYPGWSALIPIAGALFILNGGEKSVFNRILLSNKFIVWVGGISYPLYLWHWVIFSFARLIGGVEPEINCKIAMVLFSIALSWLTARFIEQPIRFGDFKSSKILIMIFILAAVGFVGMNTYRGDGLPGRQYNKSVAVYVDSVIRTSREAECFQIPYAHIKRDSWFCELGANSERANFFAFGDSHALSLIPALEAAGVAENEKILFTGTSGCPPLLGIHSIRAKGELSQFNCKSLNDRIYNYVKNRGIKNVILISRWTYYTQSLSKPSEINYVARNLDAKIDAASSEADLKFALKNTVNQFAKIGVNVFIVEDVPQQVMDPFVALKKLNFLAINDSAINKFSVTLEDHINNQKKVNEYIENSGATVIKLNPFLCSDVICPFVESGKFLYFDDDHLSVFGAKKTVPIFTNMFSGK